MASAAALTVGVLVSIGVAPDVPAELSAAAIRSCDTALGAGKCALDAPSVHGEWIATVSAPDTSLGSVRIDLRRASTGGGSESREVTFSPEDSAKERWASVGVLIAALVVSVTAEREPVFESVPPTPPAPLAPPPLPERRPPAQHPLRLDVRALVARRTGEGSPEVGGELGASYLPGRGPWFGGVSLSGARRFDALVMASWFAAALGFGVRTAGPDAPVAIELRGAALGEYWSFKASEPGRTEYDGRFRWGGLLGADALFAVHPRWALSLGALGLFAGPRMRIDVAAQMFERIPVYGALGTIGLRYIP